MTLKFLNIQLSEKDVAWARKSAAQSHQRWASKAGHYPNKARSHLIGKLGEIAVGKFLQQHHITFAPHFQYPNREARCDLEVQNTKRNLRIEVKTWHRQHWRDLGRCVAVKQREHLVHKADLIVWCVLAETEATALPVSIAGWTPIEQVWEAPVRKTGTGTMRRVENYQLETAALCSLGRLIVEIRKG